ncbi:hypothetical protein [Nitratifractor sp.]
MRSLYLAALTGTILWLGGCASTGTPCAPGDTARGYICAGGINFGKNPDPLYRQGVRDGCATGLGYFRKNYRLSSNSKSYLQGWIKGRATCRPKPQQDTTQAQATRHPVHNLREDATPSYSKPYDQNTPNRSQSYTDDPETYEYW